MRLFDGEGYPSDQTLEHIQDWPIYNMNDVRSLLAFVHDIWKYAEDGFWSEAPTIVGEPEIEYSISTGGWSGNESIIYAMQDNFLFWSSAWYSSRRGGHYTLRVDKE